MRTRESCSGGSPHHGTSVLIVMAGLCWLSSLDWFWQLHPSSRSTVIPETDEQQQGQEPISSKIIHHDWGGFQKQQQSFGGNNNNNNNNNNKNDLDVRHYSLPLIRQATKAGPPNLWCTSSIRDSSTIRAIISTTTKNANNTSSEQQEEEEQALLCVHNLQYVAIGMVKCGTATLREIAKLHPAVRIHPQEEVHFFDLQFNETSTQAKFFNQLKQTEGNRVPFPRSLADADDGYFYGDHTPSYMFSVVTRCFLQTFGKDCIVLPNYKPNIEGVVHNMQSVLHPETLIVMTLRDPVDRAFSHFAHFTPCIKDGEPRKMINHPQCFHDFVVGEIDKLRTCFDLTGNPLDMECIQLPFDFSKKEYRLVGLGLYAAFLPLWHAHFPNMCILDVVTDATHRLEGVAREFEACLGVKEPVEQIRLPESHVSQAVKRDPMYNITRKLLHNFYAPYNRLLCKIAPHTCEWSWVQASFHESGPVAWEHKEHRVLAG